MSTCGAVLREAYDGADLGVEGEPGGVQQNGVGGAQQRGHGTARVTQVAVGEPGGLLADQLQVGVVPSLLDQAPACAFLRRRDEEDLQLGVREDDTCRCRGRPRRGRRVLPPREAPPSAIPARRRSAAIRETSCIHLGRPDVVTHRFAVDGHPVPVGLRFSDHPKRFQPLG